LADLHITGHAEKDRHVQDSLERHWLPAIKEKENTAVFLLGDVFDGASTPAGRELLAYVVKSIVLAGRASGVCLLQGNHEIDGEHDALGHLLPFVRSVSRPTADMAEGSGTLLVFAPWVSKQKWISAAKACGVELAGDETMSTLAHETILALADHEAKHKILFGHANLDGAKLSSGQELSTRFSLSPKLIKEKFKFDLAVFGHIHMPQDLGVCSYVGSDANLTWGETDLKKSFIVIDLGEELKWERRWYDVPERKTVTVQWEGGVFSPDKLIALPEKAEAKIRVEFPPTDDRKVVEAYVRQFCEQNLKCRWVLEFACVRKEVAAASKEARKYESISEEVEAELKEHPLKERAVEFMRNIEGRL